MSMERWPGGFRMTEQDGPDRCWLEAIAQVLTRPTILPVLLLAVLSNTALLLIVIYLVVAS